jgi:hypothetical protein
MSLGIAFLEISAGAVSQVSSKPRAPDICEKTAGPVAPSNPKTPRGEQGDHDDAAVAIVIVLGVCWGSLPELN